MVSMKTLSRRQKNVLSVTRLAATSAALALIDVLPLVTGSVTLVCSGTAWFIV